MALQHNFLHTLLVVPLGAVCLASGPAQAEVQTIDQHPGSGMYHHIAVDEPRNPSYMFATDTPRHVIYRKNIKSGVWEVLAGQDGTSGFRDGPANQSLFDSPTGICLNHVGATVVADSGNSCIRQISPAGMVTTLAGVCGKPGAKDGPAAQALFSNAVKSIVCLSNCSVEVGDVGTGRLRMIIVHDPACEAASRKVQGRTFSTMQVLLLMVGCTVVATLAGAAAALAAQRHLQAASTSVIGYRELRETVDPAPPPETRRRAFQLMGERWNVRHQAAEMAAKLTSPALISGGPGSMGTDSRKCTSTSCTGALADLLGLGTDGGQLDNHTDGHKGGGSAGQGLQQRGLQGGQLPTLQTSQEEAVHAMLRQLGLDSLPAVTSASHAVSLLDDDLGTSATSSPAGSGPEVEAPARGPPGDPHAFARMDGNGPVRLPVAGGMAEKLRGSVGTGVEKFAELDPSDEKKVV